MLWNLFCRVVDNFGDIGVCWRLARELDARGERVRLWVDDPAALAWMAPDDGRGTVEIVPWTDPPPPHDPGDVVIEAFGCDLPSTFVSRMARNAAMGKAPVWLDLEYLTAEGYAGRSHGLKSPQSAGPGAGLDKWFYYPGFDSRTGGLIRERELPARRLAFDGQAWLRERQIDRRPGERLVSLFCYPNDGLASLLTTLSKQPTLLLVTPGHAATQMALQLGSRAAPGGLRVVSLPFMAQDEFDHLLWACDLNFVRGEDSFVRAQWAGRPFVWQAYPQHDSAHDLKIAAFLDRMLAIAEPDLSAALHAVHRRWNGGAGKLILPPLPRWAEVCDIWREQLLQQADLVTGLIRFVAERQ